MGYKPFYYKPHIQQLLLLVALLTSLLIFFFAASTTHCRLLQLVHETAYLQCHQLKTMEKSLKEHAGTLCTAEEAVKLILDSEYHGADMLTCTALRYAQCGTT